MAVAAQSSVGDALLMSFYVCSFSLCTVFLMVLLDWWAEKQDGVDAQVSVEEKFKLSDLKEFKDAPYWLLTISCTFGYMSFDSYCQFSADMLQNRFGFGDFSATLYSMPSICSVLLSPVVGVFVDRYGCRTRLRKSIVNLLFFLFSCLRSVSHSHVSTGDNYDATG